MNKDKVISDLSYAYGCKVGEEVSRKLPTLSVDAVTSCNVISVSESEDLKYKEILNTWSTIECYDEQSSEKKDLLWEEYLDYRRMLESKYLPEQHKILVDKVLIEGIDIDKLKEGIGSSMWDSDLSHYDCIGSNIEIEEHNRYLDLVLFDVIKNVFFSCLCREVFFSYVLPI